MSTEILTKSELAYMQKKTKEVNVEEVLSSEMLDKAQHAFDAALQQTLPGLTLGAELVVESVTLESFESANGQTVLPMFESDDVLAITCVPTIATGRHLLLAVPSTPEVSEVLTEMVSSVMTTLYDAYSETTDIQLGVSTVTHEQGALTTLESVTAFDLEQLCEIKVLTVTLSSGVTSRVVHLSDVAYMDYFYKRFINEPVPAQETIAQPQPRVVNEPTVGVSALYKPDFGQLSPTEATEGSSDLDLLADVALEISVMLGRTKYSVREVLDLNVGGIIELDRYVDDPLEIYANNKLIAEGEVVVVDESFGIKITKLHSNLTK